MKIIDKVERLNNLFDLYNNLLTEKQQEYFMMYYQDDLSLFEIAEAHNVSRNAVHDQIQKVEKYLESYEVKLQLLEKLNKRKQLLALFEKSGKITYLDELRKMDDNDG